MTHDTALKYLIIPSQGHLEGYHVHCIISNGSMWILILFHPLRLVNIHLILQLFVCKLFHILLLVEVFTYFL